MNYKLKHLAKFCCRPQNETEFEAIKMAAELGGVSVCDDMTEFSGLRIHVKLDENNKIADYFGYSGNYEEILVIDFIKKLRMTEEEAQALEDDIVELYEVEFQINHCISDDYRSYLAKDGYTWQTRNNGKECYLVKDK